MIQGCKVEQATAIKASFQFIPGLVAHDPPRSIDDICLEDTGRRKSFDAANLKNRLLLLLGLLAKIKRRVPYILIPVPVLRFPFLSKGS